MSRNCTGTSREVIRPNRAPGRGLARGRARGRTAGLPPASTLALRHTGGMDEVAAKDRDPYRLERFAAAQDRGGTYERAVAELRAAGVEVVD